MANNIQIYQGLSGQSLNKGLNNERISNERRTKIGNSSVPMSSAVRIYSRVHCIRCGLS